MKKKFAGWSVQFAARFLRAPQLQVTGQTSLQDACSTFMRSNRLLPGNTTTRAVLNHG